MSARTSHRMARMAALTQISLHEFHAGDLPLLESAHHILQRCPDEIEIAISWEIVRGHGDLARLSKIGGAVKLELHDRNSYEAVLLSVARDWACLGCTRWSSLSPTLDDGSPPPCNITHLCQRRILNAHPLQETEIAGYLYDELRASRTRMHGEQPASACCQVGRVSLSDSFPHIHSSAESDRSDHPRNSAEVDLGRSCPPTSNSRQDTCPLFRTYQHAEAT